MKVLLIKPLNPTGSGYTTKFGFLPTPLGLQVLAAQARAIGINDVRIVDMEADDLTADQMVEYVERWRPDVIGITLHATAAHAFSQDLAKRIKAIYNPLIVAGGHQATFVPGELLDNGFDIIVLGEGDEAFRDVLEHYRDNADFSDIPGIIFKSGNMKIRTEKRELIDDLDRLPIPAFDLVDKERYTFKVFGEGSVATVETARGCPYACDFCSVTPTWGNKWRNKSNDRIMEELRIVKSLGYRWVFFTDDIFVVYPNVKQRSDLFDRIIEEDLGLKFIVQMRADVTSKNPDLIRKASQAGLTIAFLGIESGSEEVLKAMHKGIMTSASVNAVKILTQNNIVVLGGMMLGAPYESFRDMMKTIKFSRVLARAGIDAIQISTYTPLPGTRIFLDALRKNEIFTLDWSRYDILTPVAKTRVNPAIIQALTAYGYYSFYAYKWLHDRLHEVRAVGFKDQIMMNAQKFIMRMMPSYIKDIFRLPSDIMKTAILYRNGIRKRIATDEHVRELIADSSSIVYKETDVKNPYFKIKTQ
ncbi:P-methyltransferase related protein [Thermoplasma acidophilum]|uniref:p-methyltransferase related protein n=1 Tax=Thermoplasma acidophilum (strain ATCC 25905 / DSM 1728 / JCM 9062 / NBRC 15155 / AMRC-C165) TaxID=273075 RepID=Q9HKV2_THEAC|nr:radical SAM protein [Thermoplasma acidophilum]MCY0852326.1 radical SAM protein [Thermoplasma acidophilum]CAC11633.1 P-methyltransferase related protein [Thermoplasma acidophilum]